MRIIKITLFIVSIFLVVLLVNNHYIDRSVCSSTLTAFHNSVTIFEKINNRYPDTLEELQNFIDYLGTIDTKRYTWIESQNGLPPQLFCNKHNRSSLELDLKY